MPDDQNFYNKPINNSTNHTTTNQDLNALYDIMELPDDDQDLYAARLTKPPEVKPATNSEKRRAPASSNSSKISKPKATTQKKRIIVVPEEPAPDMMDEDEDIIMEPSTPSLPTQPMQPPNTPTVRHAQTAHPTADNNKETAAQTSRDQQGVKNKRSSIPVFDKINYDITADVLNKKADINIKDLIIAVPGLKQ